MHVCGYGISCIASVATIHLNTCMSLECKISIACMSNNTGMSNLLDIYVRMHNPEGKYIQYQTNHDSQCYTLYF